MANTYKNIVITPNVGNTSDPRIQFSGGNTTANTDINLYVYPTSNGTLSFEGSAGQLFSITNDLSNSLFAVSDVSGIPSLEVFANGLVSVIPFSGNVVFGNSSVNVLVNSTAVVGNTSGTHTGAIVLGSSSLSANGGVGTAGQVLHSNGSATYWAADDNAGGTVTSVATGNGLTGGAITTTGTVSVLANTGIVANATGVYVNATYIGTLSANNTTYVNGKTEGNLNVNTALTANNATYLNGQLASFYTNATNITTGTLPYAQIPANVINTTAAFTRTGITTFSANVVLGSSGLSANSSFGAAGEVLHSNGTATYWAVDDQGVTSVATGNGLTGGTITSTGTLSVVAGTGTVVNATGVHVNATYIGTLSANNTTFVNGKTEGNLNVNSATTALTANNATNLGGTAASGYQTTAGLSANIAAYLPTYTGVVNGSSHTVGTGFTANSTVVNAVSYYSGTLLVANTTVINATHLGGTAASGYQTTAGLSANVVTLTANNTTYVNGKTEGNLNVNSAIYANSSFTNAFTVGTGTYFVSNGNVGVGNAAPTDKLSVNGTTYLGANVSIPTATEIRAGNTTVFSIYSDAGVYAADTTTSASHGPDQSTFDSSTGQLQITASSLTMTGLGVGANVAYLYPNYLSVGNTTILATLSSSNLSIYSATAGSYANLTATTLTIGGSVVNSTAHTIGTTFIANTLGVYHTGTVNAASHTVGTSFTANATVVNAVSYYAGTLLVANTTVINATHLAGKTEGNLNVNNATTAYGKTEGNLNVNSAATATNSTQLGGVAAASYARKDIAETFSANVTASSMFTSNWFRSTGTSGWYSETYGGGIWMNDTTQVKTYNNKRFWAGAFAGTVSTSTDTSQLQLQNGGGTGDADVACMSFHCSGYYGSKMHLRSDGYFGIGGWSASTWRWYVNLGNGDMTAAGNVTAYSDIRLKENITPLTNSLYKIKKLNGVRFTWKNLPDVVGSPGKPDFGILAHEVEAVAPELISESSHKSPDGDPYKTVAYDKLVPLLIEAVKELSNQVDELKKKLGE